MKNVLGIIVCISSIFIGLYLGVWLCFIGGIVQIIESFKMNPINTLGLVIGIVRFLSASIVGWFSLLITFAIGQTILK